MFLLISYLLLALGVSFLCSLLEAVLLSVTPTFVATMAKTRPRLAQQLKLLREEIDRPLAAILILNTVAHTVGAAGVGAQAAQLYGSRSLALVSAILTLLILLISEIIPKTLGATHWKGLAPFSTRTLRLLIRILYPLVLVSRAVSSFVRRNKDKEARVSRAELSALAQIAREEGVVDKAESRVLSNLLRFRSVRAKDIMTPRQVMVALASEGTVAEVVADENKLQFSRFPVFEGDIENIVGFVLKHDLLLEAASGDPAKSIGELTRPVMTISENTALPVLLDRMIRENGHIIVLTEDLGGTAGVVTLEDLVETLLGIEIVDETDTAVDMRELARQKWVERARRLGLDPAPRIHDVTDPKTGRINTPATGTETVDS